MGADMININEAKQAFHLQYTNMDNEINMLFGIKNYQGNTNF